MLSRDNISCLLLLNILCLILAMVTMPSEIYVPKHRRRCQHGEVWHCKRLPIFLRAVFFLSLMSRMRCCVLSLDQFSYSWLGHYIYLTMQNYKKTDPSGEDNNSEFRVVMSVTISTLKYVRFVFTLRWL